MKYFTMGDPGIPKGMGDDPCILQNFLHFFVINQGMRVFPSSVIAIKYAITLQ
jgi:hypothetical protein